MNLSIDIEQMAKPVLSNAGRTTKTLGHRRFLSEKRLSSFCNQLDIFILSLEGSIKHLDNLSIEKARDLLTATEKTITELDEVDEALLDLEHLALKEKFGYMQKLLYKIEGRLHRIVYQDEPRIKTSQSLKEGIIKMNSHYTKKLLSE